MSDQNLKVVQGLYAAFTRGDLSSILSLLAENVQWETAFKPEMITSGGRWEGRRGVEQFFGAMFAAEKVEQLEVREFIAGGDQVVVLGFNRMQTPSNGMIYENDWVMVWTLKDGKITRFREFSDRVPARVLFAG
ncbi:MAG TPA: nuclear transport factor 2 family protein [Halomicronema sp.]